MRECTGNMIILFFVLWMILNGRVTPEIVIFGIVISGAVAVFVHQVFGYGPDNDIRILRNLPLYVLYVLTLIKEILIASFAVISVALSGDRKPDPEIVEFHSGLESGFHNVLLANSITLTPGTFTLFQKGDYFMVHCLRKEYAEGLENSSFIRLLEKMK